jgi:hypothetical protein
MVLALSQFWLLTVVTDSRLVNSLLTKAAVPLDLTIVENVVEMANLAEIVLE